MSVESAHVKERRWELGVFLALTGVLIPLATVAIVATYGLAVWLWQIFTGPPGI